MSNIGIAVRSGSFPRIVYGNELACQGRDAWVELLDFSPTVSPAFEQVTSSGPAHNL